MCLRNFSLMYVIRTRILLLYVYLVLSVCDVGLKVLHTLLVGDDGDLGLQQGAICTIRGQAKALDSGGLLMKVLLPLVQAEWSIAKLCTHVND